MIQRRGSPGGRVASTVRVVAWVAAVLVVACAGSRLAAEELRPRAGSGDAAARLAPAAPGAEAVGVNRPAVLEPMRAVPGLDHHDAARTLQTVALLGLISLAP